MCCQRQQFLLYDSGQMVRMSHGGDPKHELNSFFPREIKFLLLATSPYSHFCSVCYALSEHNKVSSTSSHFTKPFIFLPSPFQPSTFW